jgi:hypothetical protein
VRKSRASSEVFGEQQTATISAAARARRGRSVAFQAMNAGWMVFEGMTCSGFVQDRFEPDIWSAAACRRFLHGVSKLPSTKREQAPALQNKIRQTISLALW